MIRQYLANRRLARIVKPDPALRQRRLGRMGTPRRNRYLKNVAAITNPEWADFIDNRRRDRIAAIKAMT